MHDQITRLSLKVWIVWMSSTINIIINSSKQMTNYSFKMGTFSFWFLENFCQLQLSVGQQSVRTAVEPKRLNWKSDLLESVASSSGQAELESIKSLTK